MNLTKSLNDLAQELQVKFVLDGNPIKNEEVFSEMGLLPALVKRADRLCLLCLGYGVGASFVDDEKSILGVKVQFDEVTPNVLRLACLYDVLAEIVDAAPLRDQVSLDELMYD